MPSKPSKPSKPSTPRSAPLDRASPGLEHLELAMRSGRLGVWELDTESGRLRWSDNAPEALGWTKDELPGTMDELFERIPEEDRHHPRERLRRLVAGEADVPRAEFRVRQDDGGMLWVEARRQLTVSSDGRTVATGTFHNISERKTAELELEESEERLRLALTAARVGTWEYKVPEDRVIWSPETLEIFGLSPEEFGGTMAAFTEEIHPDDRRAVQRELLAALESGDSFRVEHRIVHSELGLRWVRGAGQIRRDPDGTPIRMVGTVLDVTREIETRGALEEQKALLARQARILEQTQAAARVGGFERDFTTGEAWWTEQMYELRGFDPETFDPSTDDIWVGFGPSARRTLERAIGQVQARMGFQEVEVPVAHPVRGKLWLRVALAPMHRPDSEEVTGYYGALTDITRRKQEEDLLVRVARAVSTGTGEGFLRSVVRDLVTTFEAEEGFVGLVEPDPDAPDGQAIRTIARYSVEGSSEPLVYPVEATPCEEVVAGKVRLYHKGVARRFPRDKLLNEMGCESYAGAPIRDRSGAVIGLLGVFSTCRQPFPTSAVSLLQIFAARTGAELQRMTMEEALAQKERELYQSQKMEAIGKLAGGIAHDFNNLLTVINSSAEMARLDLESTPPDLVGVLESLAEIRASGGRAAELTRQLLAFSRKQILQTGELDPAEVIREASSLLGRLLGDVVEVRHRFEHGELQVRGDRSQLEQVLMNLAVNARDAMPDGGTLTLETRVLEAGPDLPPQPGPDRWLRLSVTDTGVGIPEDIRAQIFEPFFTTKAPGTGTGLGLSTVYGIVRQSGGFVSVDSAPGEGSTFHIDLPAWEGSEADHRSTDPGGPAEAVIPTGLLHPVSPTSPPAADLRVLVLEDDEDVRRATVNLLRDRGCSTVECRSLDEVEGALSDSPAPVDVILTDRLAERGEAARGSGRRLEELAGGIPLLLMAEYGSGADPRRPSGRTASGATTLVRPVPAELLLRTLRQIAPGSQDRP